MVRKLQCPYYKNKIVYIYVFSYVYGYFVHKIYFPVLLARIYVYTSMACDSVIQCISFIVIIWPGFPITIL